MNYQKIGCVPFQSAGERHGWYAAGYVMPRPPGFPVCQSSRKGCAAGHMTKQNNMFRELTKTFFCLWDTKMRFLAVFMFFGGFCSYEAKAEDQPIQTFVIPHSHMDVGWVYTIQVSYSSKLWSSCALREFLIAATNRPEWKQKVTLNEPMLQILS